MEKLDYPWHIYVGDDMWIWHSYPVGASVHCTLGMSVVGEVAWLRVCVRA